MFEAFSYSLRREIPRSSYLEFCIGLHKFPEDHGWRVTSAEFVEILGFRAAASGKKGGEGYD